MKREASLRLTHSARAPEARFLDRGSLTYSWPYVHYMSSSSSTTNSGELVAHPQVQRLARLPDALLSLEDRGAKVYQHLRDFSWLTPADKSAPTGKH